MSWRTEGKYRGLSAAEEAWLRDFDRKWDTKEAGRSRTDALNADALWLRAFFKDPTVLPAAPVSESVERIELEASLLRAASEIKRFTVPRQTKSGWSIHVVMKCGQRVRAHFDDLKTATQAYEAIEEFLLWFPRG